MEISKEDFARVLRAATLDIDWKEFGITLAGINPTIFMEVANIVTGKNWQLDAQLRTDEGSSRSEVIRFVKDASGMSLLESKHWVEANIAINRGV